MTIISLQPYNPIKTP